MKVQASNQKYLVFVFVAFLITFGAQVPSYGQNLDVGEPRTVRMIYFLPNDRPFRQEVVDSMKAGIRYAQTFFAEQMQSHGYGNTTFQFEVDAQGEPLVHRVDGQLPDSHYGYGDLDKVVPGQEIADHHQYLRSKLTVTVYDASGAQFAAGGRNGKNSGGAELGAEGILYANKAASLSLHADEPHFGTMIHELGHAFGLEHDWRDGSYIMSYGPGPSSRLSACAAEFLAVHPYFNPDIPLEDGTPPTVELISSLGYPTGATSVSVRLKVSDSDGIHQVILFAQGGLKLCKGLNGEKEAIVAFDYDGIISAATAPSRIGTSLSSPLVHLMEIGAVDVNGDVGSVSFELFDVSTRSGHVATLKGHRNQVNSVAFSPDGTTLASGSWDMFKLWDVRTQQNIATFDGYGSDVSAVAFSTDGTLAVGSNKLELWDIGTQQNIATFEEGNVSAVAFSPDGTTLASRSWNGTIGLWDIGTQENIATFKGHVSVTAIAFSTEGILASGGGDGDKTLKLWDVATLTNIHTLGGRGSAVAAAAFHGTTLAFGGGFSWVNIELLDVETRTNIATFEGHRSNVLSIAFSPDGTLLASGSYDNTVKLWDVATARNIDTFKAAGEVPAVAFSPDGTTVAVGTSSGVVELWGVEMYFDNQVPTEFLKISEIMVASNDGSLPQWIELYNASDTHVVNLKGWTLEIQNYRSENFNGHQNITITLKEKSINPQETLLIVSKQGRPSSNFQNEQIYNLSTLHSNLQDVVLSEEGFYLKLSNTADELIDEVGNLDGKRNTNDTPAWSLPKILTKDGVRTSMIRRQDNGVPRLGTEASGWVSAINTRLATGTTSYYGHPDDIGAPGIGSGSALPVALSRFRAERTDTGVVIKWITESELDNAGFNILRSETKDGEFKIVNPQLIQGAGTTSERQTYTWTDTTVKPNIVYYYRIEDISHAGVRKQLATVRMRGYVSAAGKLTTKWGDLKLQE